MSHGAMTASHPMTDMSHVLPAMNGLTQSYLSTERLQKCEPIDLDCFVVDFRERHLDYRTSYSDLYPGCTRATRAQKLTLHLSSMVALPTRSTLVTHS